MTQEQRGQQVAKSAREIRQEAAKARLEAAKHEDSQAETVTLSALAKVQVLPYNSAHQIQKFMKFYHS